METKNGINISNNLGGAFTFAQSVSQTADGGYIMIVPKKLSESHIKAFDNGNEEWSRNFSGNSNNSLVDILLIKPLMVDIL